LWPLVLQVLLIACNAVFACAEIAVISMNDARLSHLAAEGNKRALRLKALTSQPARFLATIQVAITLSGFLGSAFAADNFSGRIVTALLAAGVTIPAKTLDTICVILITLILSYFTLVFGELVPKRLAMKNAEKLALGMSGLITFISKAFAPLVWLLTKSTDGVLRLLGVDPAAENDAVTEEEIRMMIDEGIESGAIDPEEKRMLTNVFEFDDAAVGDIATHRTRVDMLDMEDGDEVWSEQIHDKRHSFYPVCEGSPDRIVGVLDAKSWFRLEDRSRESAMAYAVEKPYFVQESMKADVLFANMKRRRCHFAVVLDMYGGVAGIITMNDLVEEIVGDLPDDSDTVE
jgi:putative hemolysin